VAGLSQQSVTPNLIHDDPGILYEPMRIALTGLSGTKWFSDPRISRRLEGHNQSSMPRGIAARREYPLASLMRQQADSSGPEHSK